MAHLSAKNASRIHTLLPRLEKLSASYSTCRQDASATHHRVVGTAKAAGTHTGEGCLYLEGQQAAHPPPTPAPLFHMHTSHHRWTIIVIARKVLVVDKSSFLSLHHFQLRLEAACLAQVPHDDGCIQGPPPHPLRRPLSARPRLTGLPPRQTAVAPGLAAHYPSTAWAGPLPEHRRLTAHPAAQVHHRCCCSPAGQPCRHV